MGGKWGLGGGAGGEREGSGGKWGGKQKLGTPCPPPQKDLKQQNHPSIHGHHAHDHHVIQHEFRNDSDIFRR